MVENIASVLSTLSIISFSIAAIALVASIVIFIVFKIPAVIGDLNGRTARKSIDAMRSRNTSTGKKSYVSSKTNLERGMLTDTIQNIDSKRKANASLVDDPETDVLDNNKSVNAGVETALLQDDDETTLLNETLREATPRAGGVALTVTNEVIMIHTDEVI